MFELYPESPAPWSKHLAARQSKIPAVKTDWVLLTQMSFRQSVMSGYSCWLLRPDPIIVEAFR